jgi:hypothetical protein
LGELLRRLHGNAPRIASTGIGLLYCLVAMEECGLYLTGYLSSRCPLCPLYHPLIGNYFSPLRRPSCPLYLLQDYNHHTFELCAHFQRSSENIYCTNEHVNIKGGFEVTPIRVASKAGYANTLTLLLDHGGESDVDDQGTTGQCRCQCSRRP